MVGGWNESRTVVELSETHPPPHLLRELVSNRRIAQGCCFREGQCQADCTGRIIQVNGCHPWGEEADKCEYQKR
jgi:hypothetical protein